MPEIDRRSFLQVGANAIFSLGIARPPVRPSARRPVVCLFLRGGLDGLSMLVPHGDSLYYRARPRTAVPATRVIDLDGYFGLHPSLAPLKPFWDEGRLTVIPAVGLPELTRSHAAAQHRIDAVLARRGAVTVGSLQDVGRLIKARTVPDVVVVNAGGWDTHVNQGSSDGQLAIRLRTLGVEIEAFARGLGERAGDVVLLTVSEFGRTIGENRNGGTDHGRATATLALGDLGQAHGGAWGRWPGLEGTDVAVTTDFRELLELPAAAG